MKNWLLTLSLALVLMMTLTGCQLIADIFQAGVWVGVIGVIVVIGLIFFVIRMFSGAR